MKKILFAVALLAFGFTSASAQYGPRHDSRDRYDNRDRYDHSARNRGGSDINYMQRQARQQIAQGVERGTLNSREANALIGQYERIEARERSFSRRGRLSPRESKIIRHDLERLMADTQRLSSRRGEGWARERRNRY
ncbi:hypothetical protein [Dyadobacter sp. CY343]|uniref:hypothetical protein n=1 Tax=Dyadobacter sp. CY343 TaxID=2907299 RepID=UPI001F3B6E24|nr:hypothetical protein [Dyadobacter sp. CY343]MCE7059542.1 hypothetical protein [Dyadobacter sp. CY343]